MSGGFPAGVFGSFETFGKYRGDDYRRVSETTTALVVSVTTPVESVAGLRSDTTFPVEVHVLVRSGAVLAIESLAAALLPTVTQAEFLAGALGTPVTPVEALASADSSPTVPVESVGTTVRVLPPVPVESLASAVADPTVPVDSRAAPVFAVAVGYSLPVESLGRKKKPKPRDFTQVPLPSGVGGLDFEERRARERDFWPMSEKTIALEVRLPVATRSLDHEDDERFLVEDSSLLRLL